MYYMPLNWLTHNPIAAKAGSSQLKKINKTTVYFWA
jgi:hypothetical protein